MKTIISLILLFLIAGFAVQDNNVDGLSVEFRKMINVYSMPRVGGITAFPNEGMVFKMLKVTLKNDGVKSCDFDFDDTYISTEQDSLYRFSFLYGFSGSKTKIKPNQEIDRILYFEFPDDKTPKELFIEDRRFKIEVK